MNDVDPKYKLSQTAITALFACFGYTATALRTLSEFFFPLLSSLISRAFFIWSLFSVFPFITGKLQMFLCFVLFTSMVHWESWLRHVALSFGAHDVASRRNQDHSKSSLLSEAVSSPLSPFYILAMRRGPRRKKGGEEETQLGGVEGAR